MDEPEQLRENRHEGNRICSKGQLFAHQDDDRPESQDFVGGQRYREIHTTSLLFILVVFIFLDGKIFVKFWFLWFLLL
jgi:hypothetical protein